MTEIRTARLLLRPPTEAEADAIAAYAGDIDIARMIRRIPHPYSRQDALDWLASMVGNRGETSLAISLSCSFIGACGFIFSPDRSTAEIGYWLGKPYWGNGYATEAAQALVRTGFERFGLAAITISHMVDNPASAHVIAKCGFLRTGTDLVHCVSRRGDVELVTYALNRGEAQAQPWYQGA